MENRMSYAVKPLACLISAMLLAFSLASCQTASKPQETQSTPPVAAEPPLAESAEPAEVAEPKPVQQAAVQPAPAQTPAAVPQPAESAEAVPQNSGSPEAEAELVFLDFAGFDEDLSREMTAERKVIAVDVPASFSLNKVPDRLDRWFSRVKETGGAVQAREKLSEEERRTRGIVGVLLEIAVSAIKAQEAEEMLRPAKDYSVLVEYDKQTGKADRVLFYQR